MKIYVATSLKKFQEVRGLQIKLREMGFKISYDWAQARLAEVQSGSFMKPYDVAVKCREGVLKADILLLWNHGTRGAHIEYGIAVGAGIPIIVVNEDPAEDISFYTLSSTPVFRDMDTAIRYLEKFRAFDKVDVLSFDGMTEEPKDMVAHDV